MDQAFYEVTRHADGWHIRLISRSGPTTTRTFPDREAAVAWCAAAGGIAEIEDPLQPGVTVAPEDSGLGTDVRSDQ